MKICFFRICLFVALSIYLPLQSMAWGMLGHRIVGKIADFYLTPNAKAEIKKILGNESLAMSSNWADFIKSDTSFRYLNPWHYVDFEKGITYDEMKAELKNDTSANVYTKTNFLVAELKKKSLSKEKKIMYLRLLVHFIGDIHQPLHVSPIGSEGGNAIKLTWFGQPSNLHRVWDEELIEYQQLSYTEYVMAINHTTLTQRKKWQQQPLSAWLFESFTISKQLHDEIKDTNPKFSYSYNFKHVQTLNEQLLKGGVRLAGVLNEIFGA